jgi:DNA-binding response OmpR family regulator
MTTKKKIILIVEDEKPLSGVLANKLMKEGYDVVEAANGAEGLAKIKKEKPNLILLDIIMPKMDGMTMLKKLRDTSVGKNIPVIILTNLSDIDKADEAVKANVKDYLIKSDWSLDDLVKKVKLKIK